MANTNFKQKEITTKSGGKYTLQHPGVRNVTRINDRIKNKHGVNSEERICEEMFKHVVVMPKMGIDDFEEYKEMVEVANKAYFFITGTPDPGDVEQEDEVDDK
ncbi:hypothetical protein GCM10010912_22900 [Paenibacillus albidus]|uniref:Phage protein n=1 Tax=Paenibacillus albidus TaxID=2041023 RepID=A0A917CBN3_9BACL|nr:hypothetical protein [Paenibacillus albidus]GGF77228.1 hypothetical protein GCM10010912_22900 [Paenibacillus albidus]